MPVWWGSSATETAIVFGLITGGFFLFRAVMVGNTGKGTSVVFAFMGVIGMLGGGVGIYLHFYPRHGLVFVLADQVEIAYAALCLTFASWECFRAAPPFKWKHLLG
jgi:hypothetical protein